MTRRKQGPEDRSYSSYFFNHTEEELQFMKAIEAYRKRYNIRHLTVVDILSVARELGYSKEKVDGTGTT